MQAQAWHSNPHHSGAYATFGPGQFRTLFPSLITPHADGRFHIAGEAASSSHAWVAGALDSAIRAVLMVLERYEAWDLQEWVEGNWGGCEDIDFAEGQGRELMELGRQRAT